MIKFSNCAHLNKTKKKKNKGKNTKRNNRLLLAYTKICDNGMNGKKSREYEKASRMKCHFSQKYFRLEVFLFLYFISVLNALAE